MTPKAIHLIRHGESTFNAAYREAGEDPMIVDAPLSALGRRQVDRLAGELCDVTFELAVTSPFTRAIQTCLGLISHWVQRPRWRGERTLDETADRTSR